MGKAGVPAVARSWRLLALREQLQSLAPWLRVGGGEDFFVAPLRGAPSPVDRRDLLIVAGSGGKVFIPRRNPWRCGAIILTPWNPGRITPLRGDAYGISFVLKSSDSI